jgi:hypothetical protein
MNSRLDPVTRQNVDDLAQYFGRPRAAVSCQIVYWGMTHEQTGLLDQGEAQGPVHHLYCSVDAERQAQVEQAAAAVGMEIAPWLRQMMRQRTMADFPASWQEARLEKRSHDSRLDGARFILRLDEPSRISDSD